MRASWRVASSAAAAESAINTTGRSISTTQPTQAENGPSHGHAERAGHVRSIECLLRAAVDGDCPVAHHVVQLCRASSRGAAVGTVSGSAARLSGAMRA